MTAVAASQNRKIGPLACTYVSQVSCPPGCPFKGNGCYAEAGPAGLTTARLNRAAAAHDLTPLALARLEADAVDALPADRDLRLHVVGDCVTPAAAVAVAAAAGRYRRRVSVLASCETTADVRAAHAAGYAAALAVTRFPSDRAFTVDGVRVVPCPAQTRPAVTCATCRLCTDDRRLHASGLAIGFAAHGSAGVAAKARRVALDVVVG